MIVKKDNWRWCYCSCYLIRDELVDEIKYKHFKVSYRNLEESSAAVNDNTEEEFRFRRKVTSSDSSELSNS